MRSKKKWLSDPNFVKLCDFVAQGNLICLTGSGISKGLRLKNSGCAPDWNELLRNIMKSVNDDLSDTERSDLDELLVQNAPGENLIEASSILYSKNAEGFLTALADSVDLMPRETSLTHKRILDLSPQGILTYNYDSAHENAIAQNSCCREWNVILPSDNAQIINILKQNITQPFLLKMHGSVNQKSSMVLTRESYRDLFVKYPFYKSFMQQIFTNHHLLIVGFRMSDPDFEMLLQNVFSTFGSPIQEHIVIKHINDKTSKDTVYRLRYGLNFLYIDNFSDIPRILDDCTHVLGNDLKDILKDCICDKIEIRGKAHSDVRSLSPVGKKCLANFLEELIRERITQEQMTDYNFNTETSEYVYTYGVIASSTKDANYTNFLIHEVVGKSIYAEPIAHALVHLRDLLKKDDLCIVEQWLARFKDSQLKVDIHNPDPHNRVYKYCESIYFLLKAKYDI